MKVSIFGAGKIAQYAYLPLLVSWPDVETSGLFSRTPERVEETCRRWHIDYGTHHAEALLDRPTDAAFVLTSDDTHFDLARRLLERGVDVYIEKPAAESAAEVEQLADLAESRGRVLMVGLNRRFAPLYRQAREIFAGRAVSLAVFEKLRPKPYHPTLYNCYLNDTIHQIDLLRFYCGEPEPVTTIYVESGDYMTGAVSLLKVPPAGQAVVQTTLRAGDWQERAALHGEELSVYVDAFRSLTVRHRDREEVYGADRPGRSVPDLVERGFHGAVKHFFDCVQSRRQPETGGREAARTHRLIEDLVLAAGVKPEKRRGFEVYHAP